jgi:hypothetical protein
MIKRLSKGMLAAVLLMTVSGSIIFAQTSPRKLVHFSVNTSQEVRMGQVVLPAGKYILRQVMESDANLFNLYQDDLTRSPIAAIRTVRINYSVTGYPKKSQFFLSNEETKQGDSSILTGWAITGLDGWKIVSVVQKKDLLVNGR